MRMMAESPQIDPGIEDDEAPPGGIFSSWAGVYWSVVVATVLMIVLLYWFTVALDHSAR